jgi:hypothetical protein
MTSDNVVSDWLTSLVTFFDETLYSTHKKSREVNIIFQSSSDEVNTRIEQPMEHDSHRGIRGKYHVSWVDQSLYSPKWKVINCFII